jgi:hypothetical protein
MPATSGFGAVSAGLAGALTGSTGASLLQAASNSAAGSSASKRIFM